MNVETQAYWNTFWSGDAPHNVDAWQFGCDPDELAQLVISGRKTATASAYIGYEAENSRYPPLATTASS